MWRTRYAFVAAETKHCADYLASSSLSLTHNHTNLKFCARIHGLLLLMNKHAGKFDHCGKCDAESLNDCQKDCLGKWGGHTTLDACGKCGGDGSGCSGCDDVPHSGKVVDKCGICGGDNTKCQDCAGVPRGNARKDKCGKCDADPGTDCKQDCSGTWGGKATRDTCGTCDTNPDNDCKPDCSGKYGGTFSFISRRLFMYSYLCRRSTYMVGLTHFLALRIIYLFGCTDSTIPGTKKRDKCGVCGGPGGPCLCNRVQRAIIAKCKTNCKRCHKSERATGGKVNKILAKCKLSSRKSSQIFGITFCSIKPKNGHKGSNKPISDETKFHPTKFWSRLTKIGSMLSTDGRAVKGKIDFIKDGKLQKTTHVWYLFNALEGHVYQLETKAGTLHDTVMQLVGPDEITTIAENDNDERVSNSTTSFLRWRCPADAGYFLVVSSGRDGNQVGTYKVSVKQLPGGG